MISSLDLHAYVRFEPVEERVPEDGDWYLSKVTRVAAYYSDAAFPRPSTPRTILRPVRTVSRLNVRKMEEAV